MANQTFRISSALKDIIGRDLITNDLVAVFELVKNAFDAHASQVDIVFLEGAIAIADDGKGMSRDDILEKWLFVAYSAKKTGEEDRGLHRDYRDRIAARRGFAGNKGIGRFSCDRLGEVLDLYSRAGAGKHAGVGRRVEHLKVAWGDFELDSKTAFGDVPTQLASVAAFPPLPQLSWDARNGTLLIVSGLRDSWDRDKLLKLKGYLAKLVDPFGTQSDMRIVFHAPSEALEDERVLQGLVLPPEMVGRHADVRDAVADLPVSFAGVVNGPVGNLVFETLESKTTKLEVRLDAHGSARSRLVDRGRLIYEIEEACPFKDLVGATIGIDLFYLNRAAKASFTRAMGIDSVGFGNVFLFLNGFRIFPVGEPSDDTFGLNVRKAQGYARYLGTREILGRVDIDAPAHMFRETSSRDAGLIESPRVAALMEAFRRLGLHRLERYVVDIAWVDKLDADRLDTSGLTTEAARARIIELVSRLVENPRIRLIAYADDLVDTINERANLFETTMKGLSVVASSTGDKPLLKRIEQARRRYEAMRKSERQANERADSEAEARVEAQAQAKDAQVRADVAEERFVEEHKRSLFLAALGSREMDTLVNLHHQVVIYATSVQDLIANNLRLIGRGRMPSAEDLSKDLEQMSFQNSRILAVTRFATQANFRLDADAVEEDLVRYLSDYVAEVSSMYAGRDFVQFEEGGQSLRIRFRPIDIAIIVDNLISNAKRASASRIAFRCRSKGADLEIVVEDDGLGIDPRKVDRTRLFEKGYSTTRGSGLGLYHVTEVLAFIRGTIAVDPDHAGVGLRFIIRIPRPRKANA